MSGHDLISRAAQVCDMSGPGPECHLFISTFNIYTGLCYREEYQGIPDSEIQYSLI